MSHILRSFKVDPSPSPDKARFTLERKEASEHTKVKWDEVVKNLNFADQTDYENAMQGFLAKPSNFTITNQKGDPVWDMQQFESFIPPNVIPENKVPKSINPSLYRVAQLNMHYGLFTVLEDKIYQVRGFDLSNITFVKGKSGWIVMDPLISKECSEMALSLVNYELYTKKGQAPPPVTAIIYSHSHIDHYGGIMGVISESEKQNVEILASKGFTEDAVSENVIAGNAMSRRAVYMYGSLLPRDQQGLVCAGLGMTTSIGSTGLVKPTKIISRNYQTEKVDGIEMEFQFTPGTEAPTEMNTWFPEWNALWMAENTTNTMHNLLTLRGAQVRDALVWSSYLTNTINRYGQDAVVKFQAHHWPIWKTAEHPNAITDYLKKQRAVYQYTHDQSVRMMNKGLIGTEIASNIKMFRTLETEWSTRGYYGTLSHNSHAVYQRYMGWYSGNPSDLNKLPQTDVAKKYVEYIGSEEEVISKAYVDFLKGDYRWVAEVMRHVVFNNPDSYNGKCLLADTYEQLGYQAESGAWRGCYLQGAYELRNGKPQSGLSTISEDVVRNMTPTMLFNFWGVHMDPSLIDFDNALTVNIHLLDMDLDTNGEDDTIIDDIASELKGPNWYALIVEYGCLVASPEAAENPDATITTTTDKLYDLYLGGPKHTSDWLNDPGVMIADDEKPVVEKMFTLFDTQDEMMFNIVTP
ncbi:alkyl sulfatase [Gracilaria domingensis]|nr:alkyl sulfatase [Gracilaria domingensis]